MGKKNCLVWIPTGEKGDWSTRPAQLPNSYRMLRDGEWREQKDMLQPAVWGWPPIVRGWVDLWLLSHRSYSQKEPWWAVKKYRLETAVHFIPETSKDLKSWKRKDQKLWLFSSCLQQGKLILRKHSFSASYMWNWQYKRCRNWMKPW